jgi:hypothetical protein
VAEHLPSRSEALGSISSTGKKKDVSKFKVRKCDRDMHCLRQANLRIILQDTVRTFWRENDF